jgi:DNA invertase Pin-like site-specific DNA recombinase
MRTFGYTRVSTDKQVEEGESLEVQRRQIEGYALMHGLALDRIVVEEGVSGSVPVAARPQGGPLFAKLKKGDIVIAPKLDRLFRSALDALQVVEDLRKRGVSLHLLDLGGDISGNGLSKLFLTVAAAFAEAERDRIRERIRDAKRHLTSQGIFSGGKRPFGYDIVVDGETKRFVPNADEMRVIGRMQAMRKDGATFRAIGTTTGHDPKSVQRILARAAR